MGREGEWTATNSERMVSYSPKLWEAPGEALPDWDIVARFARTLGFKGFDYQNAGAVWDEFIQMTSGRPCEMAATRRQVVCEKSIICNMALAPRPSIPVANGVTWIGNSRQPSRRRLFFTAAITKSHARFPITSFPSSSRRAGSIRIGTR